MRFFLLISFSILCLEVFPQPVYDSTKVSPLVKQIAFQIDTNTLHYEVNRDEYFAQLQILKQRAKLHELVQLVNHPNPFIRVNAFDYLLDLAYPKFVDVIEQHLKDTAFVYLESSQDLVTETNVIEAMLLLVSWNSNWIGKFEFTEADIKRISALGESYWNSKKKK